MTRLGNILVHDLGQGGADLYDDSTGQKVHLPYAVLGDIVALLEYLYVCTQERGAGTILDADAVLPIQMHSLPVPPDVWAEPG